MNIPYFIFYPKAHPALQGATLSAVVLPFASSVIAAVGFLAVPVVCISLYIFYSGRRDRLLTSPLLPGVPLLLIPLCLQVLYAAATFVETFRVIAAQKTSGPVAIYSMLIEIQRSTLWRSIEIALGLIFLSLLWAFQTIRKKEPLPLEEVNRIRQRHSLDLTEIFIFLFVLATGGLLWFSADFVHVIDLFIDPGQKAALAMRFGHIGVEAFAGYVIRSLTIQAVAAVNLMFVLLVLGIKVLTNYVPQRRDAWISGVLAVLLLAGIGGAIADTVLSIRNMQEKIAAHTSDLGRDLLSNDPPQ